MNAVNQSEVIAAAAQSIDWEKGLQPRGVVRRVGDGVAFIVGLPLVRYEEILLLDSGAFAMAYDLRRDGFGAVLLMNADRVSAGDGVFALNQLPQLPVGEQTLGRIIDPLGHSLDEEAPLSRNDQLPLFRAAPEILDRVSVTRSLWTGILAIDAAIPIGRGQRELIIGDRNVGKTALALDIVLAQRLGNVRCVYVVIGQPMSRVLVIRQILEQAGCLENTVIVAAPAGSSPGLQYLAPYAGASIAEWFRERGEHALVVFDDLTKHADAYRELALLLDRPPGREAYPGDIFYIHAELLERAAPLRPERGGGSVTALPIIETTDGDISSYIPTNLISITDGQIYLDSGRFERNQRPAIDIGRSVSRIGSIAQPPAMRQASKNLKIQLSRFESLERLSRVGLEMDLTTQTTLRSGNVLRSLLRQNRFSPRGIADQVLMLIAAQEGWFDQFSPSDILAAVTRWLDRLRFEVPEVWSVLETGSVPTGDWKSRVAALVSPEVALAERGRNAN